MAILNGLYVHVVNERVGRSVQATDHPVEAGIPTTDMVKAKALTISLSGKIVDYGNMKANQVLSRIEALQKSGSLILYQGRNVASNMQIRSFDTSFPNTISGGADFTMELTQVHIAQSAYVPKDDAADERERAAKALSPDDITVGMKIIFKGGPVYKSSDAKKKSATRERSTCTVTKISNKSYSIHRYHLKSTDGKKVYGWVDFDNLEAIESTSTNGTTNAGTKQVTRGTGTAVYHTVKKGDTVYALVNGSYKNLGKTVQWVMDNNPNAFSRAGDARTLQIGAKLLMGYR